MDFKLAGDKRVSLADTGIQCRAVKMWWRPETPSLHGPTPPCAPACCTETLARRPSCCSQCWAPSATALMPSVSACKRHPQVGPLSLLPLNSAETNRVRPKPINIQPCCAFCKQYEYTKLGGMCIGLDSRYHCDHIPWVLQPLAHVPSCTSCPAGRHVTTICARLSWRCMFGSGCRKLS